MAYLRRWSTYVKYAETTFDVLASLRAEHIHGQLLEDVKIELEFVVASNIMPSHLHDSVERLSTTGLIPYLFWTGAHLLSPSSGKGGSQDSYETVDSMREGNCLQFYPGLGLYGLAASGMSDLVQSYLYPQHPVDADEAHHDDGAAGLVSSDDDESDDTDEKSDKSDDDDDDEKWDWAPLRATMGAVSRPTLAAAVTGAPTTTRSAAAAAATTAVAAAPLVTPADPPQSPVPATSPNAPWLPD